MTPRKKDFQTHFQAIAIYKTQLQGKTQSLSQLIVQRLKTVILKQLSVLKLGDCEIGWLILRGIRLRLMSLANAVLMPALCGLLGESPS